MIVFNLAPSVLIVDTDAVISFTDAQGLVSDGYKARGGYLGQITPAELADQLRAGLPFYPICFAKNYDGAQAVAHANALGLPRGTRIWFDVEGVTDDAPTLIAKLNTGTDVIVAAGFKSGAYFGEEPVLTSAEASVLKLDRYGHGCSIVVDRFGAAMVPSRGFAWFQGRPDDVTIRGKKYDVSFATLDDHDGCFEVVAP